MENRENRWLLFAVILLTAFLVFRIVDQSQMLWQFPLDQNNDLSSYMGQLHELKQYGFHAVVPNWYNGYISFLNYPPAWFFFTLPLYNFFGNILAATFASNILLYIFGFIFFLLIGKFAKLSFTKTLFFYLVFYANPISIGNFIKLGRLPELMGATLFLAFFAFLLYLKQKDINFKDILIFAALYSLIILTHPSWLIFSTLMLPGIFLLKDKEGRLKIILSFLLSLLLTSFWLLPFVKSSFATALGSLTGLSRLLNFSRQYLFDNLLSFILPLSLFVAANFYFRESKKDEMLPREEIIFYTFPLLIAFLYVFRIATFLPILNKPYPDSYHIFFIFFGTLFFLKTPLEVYGRLGKLIRPLLLVLPILFIIPSQFFIPNFRVHNQIDNEIISLLPNVSMDDKLIIVDVPYPTSPLAFYSYIFIYNNLSTPGGWEPFGAVKGVSNMILDSKNNLEQKDCVNLTKNLGSLNATLLITHKDYCNSLTECGMSLKEKTESICLYKITNNLSQNTSS